MNKIKHHLLCQYGEEEISLIDWISCQRILDGDTVLIPESTSNDMSELVATVSVYISGSGHIYDKSKASNISTAISRIIASGLAKKMTSL